MKVYEINGKEYKIGRLTIQDYYNLKRDIYVQDLESSFSLVSKITGCPEEDLRSLSYQNWLTLLVDVQEQVNRALSETGEALKTCFEFEDTLYGMLDLNECTIGEFVDLDIILSSPDVETRLHEIMSILFRPVIDPNEIPYRIQPYDSAITKVRAEAFKKMDLYQARKALGFFLDFVRVSFEHTLEYSIQLMRESKMLTQDQIERIKAILWQLHEAGIQLSSSSHLKIPSDLMKQQNFTTKRPSTSSRGESTGLNNNSERWMKFLKNIGHN
jgi:hypothetical protein